MSSAGNGLARWETTTNGGFSISSKEDESKMSSTSNPQGPEKHGDGGGKEEVRFGGGTSFCLKCKNKNITYEADPCGCPCFCTDCARKLATGGKCGVCGEFFGGLRRIRVGQEDETQLED